MKKYSMVYQETVEHSAIIEAEDEENAIDIFYEKLRNQELPVDDRWNGEFYECMELPELIIDNKHN